MRIAGAEEALEHLAAWARRERWREVCQRAVATHFDTVCAGGRHERGGVSRGDRGRALRDGAGVRLRGFPCQRVWREGAQCDRRLSRPARLEGGDRRAGLFARAAEQGNKARSVAVRVRFNDFDSRSRQQTLDDPTDSPETLIATALACLEPVDLEKPVRLIGLRVTGLRTTHREPPARLASGKSTAA